MLTGILFCARGIGLGLTLTPEWLVIPASLAVSLAVGALIGFLNGFFTIKLKMNAFIVTLASYIWVRGLVVAISGGRSAQDLAPALRVIGIETVLYVPLIAWIAIGCFAVFSFVMTRTPFGRHVTLVGGNPVAAFRAGIKVDRLMFISFILAGAIAGLAGWLLAIRTSGATANLGTGMLFNAFAAVDSTERSMCPAMMTIARPMAMTPTKVDCSMMLAKMPIWKKFGTKSEKAISTVASMNQTRWSSTNSANARLRGDVISGSLQEGSGPGETPGP
jgi:ABC-type xylose transport system permease subunit